MQFGLCLCVAAGIVGISASYVDDVWRTDANKQLAEEGLQGMFMSNGGMSIYVSLPDVSIPVPKSGFPCVIVAHHAVGIYHATFLREYADNLAKEGYVAVLPDFFHRVWSDDIPTGKGAPFSVMKVPALLKSLKDVEVLQDLQDLFGTIQRNAGEWRSDKKRIAVLGFCMGGRIAWLAGVNKEFAGLISGIVPYHGGNVFKTWPNNAAEVTPPGSHLEKLHCPVLGHFGELDQNPSLGDMGTLKAQAQKSGNLVEFHTYTQADHGFSCKDSAKYVQEAAEVAWKRTLVFLVRIFDKDSEKNEL